MAERKAIVQIGGQLQELPAGDTLSGAVGSGGGSAEPTGATYAYSAGVLTQVTETVDGSPRVTTYTFNADGTVASAVTTHLGLTETTTYTYAGSAVTSYTRT